MNQTVEEDAMIPGLCAFLLGVIYEFNREPGEVTRSVPNAPSTLTNFVLIAVQFDYPPNPDTSRHRHAVRAPHPPARR